MSFHRSHWLLFGTVFFGFIGLAAVIAIVPAYWVQGRVETHMRSQAEESSLSPLERRGLAVYIAEGCVACHTQQVRPLAMDRRWGRPSTPQDYARLGGPMDLWRPYTPAVLGSSRNGPDLSDAGSRQPAETWQYMHMYNPRSVVADSIMPAYPWLFRVVAEPDPDATVVGLPEAFRPAEGTVVPTPRAEALVAYLLSRRQPAEAAAEGASADGGTGGDAEAAAARPAESAAQGSKLYATHCAACHQTGGAGVEGAFPPLAGDPVVTADDPTRHIDIILNGAQGQVIDGVSYSAAMPGFASRLSDAEIAAIVNHERTSWGNDAPTVDAGDVARVRGSSGP